MPHDNEGIPLGNRVDGILSYIDAQKSYLEHNHVVFDIYEGNLLPYVAKVLQDSLSDNYYEKIKSRIIPINVLRKIVDKLAKVYATAPMRFSDQQESVDFYEEQMKVNKYFNIADEFSYLFKGYALEPFMHKGVPRLRTLPFDKFLVMSDDHVDPLNPTVFIKFIGKRKVDRGESKKGETEDKEIYFLYTDEEFLAVDEDGKTYGPAMVDNDGVNPFGVIPFMYGSRSNHSLLPTQDTDLLAMSHFIPVTMTDLAGSILFQCFTIIYGIDVDAKDMTMSPNAFWSIKSDPQSDKQPQLGTIKPEADVDKVIRFVMTGFTLWLESIGVKVGSVGNINGENLASGVAKIIDNMDTFETRLVAIKWFQEDERKFWDLMKVMNNKWVEMGELPGQPLLPDDFKVNVIHDEPQPLLDREKEVRTKKLEVDSSFLDQRTAIMELYPDLSDEEVEERLVAVKENRELVISLEDNGEVAKN